MSKPRKRPTTDAEWHEYSKELMEAVRRGEEDIKAGRVIPWEVAKKELGIDVTDPDKRPDVVPPTNQIGSYAADVTWTDYALFYGFWGALWGFVCLGIYCAVHLVF
jgi:hypothetical protein